MTTLFPGMLMTQGGIESTLNNSITAINNGANFTGEWEECGRYESMVVAVKTDQDGYYEIQFSPDKTNTDSTLTRYYRTALVNPPHRFTCTRKYVRVVFYNNSGSNQTYFRLQVFFGPKQALNVPLGGVVSLDYDASIVRPVDYDQDVARGLWQGRESWTKFGYNPDIDTTTDPEVVWANGATFGAATILTSASTFTVVSSASTDNASGTGANSLAFYYIDSNGLPATGTHTMHATDGTTSTATSFSGYGINRVAVLSSGSSYANDGAITITATTGGNQQAIIPIGGSVTQQCIFYTPHGYQGMINGFVINALKVGVGTTPVVKIRGYVFNVLTTQTQYELMRLNVDTSIENTITLNFKQPLVLNSSDVFWLTAETDANDTEVSARFSLTINRINST